MVHTRSRTSTKQSVKAILPNVKGTGSKSGIEKDTLVAEHPAIGDDEDDSELVQVLAAELQKKDEYEDEELLDVHETYQQVRMKMNDAKKARGYRSTSAASVGVGKGLGNSKGQSQQDWSKRRRLHSVIDASNMATGSESALRARAKVSEGRHLQQRKFTL